MSGGIPPVQSTSPVVPPLSGAPRSTAAEPAHPASAAPARTSGIFAPLTALPGDHGMGDMGPAARRFVDALHDGGQRVWLIPPLALPGDPSNSPYSSHSPFAYNRWLISPEQLVADGLLSPHDLAGELPAHDSRVDYGAAQQWKGPLLDRAADNLLEQAKEDPQVASRLAAFEEKNRSWLPDYANFMHLKQHYASQPDPRWSRATWPLADRHAATATLPAEPTHQMRRLVAEQFIADQQFTGLRDYAKSRGIHMALDVAAYEGDDSVGPWKHPERYLLDEQFQAQYVGGSAPDPSFPIEQKWGMPGYDTSRRQELLRQFSAKISHEAERVGPGGYIRLDHLLGIGQPYVVWNGVGPAPEGGGGYQTLFSAEEFRSLLDRHPDVNFFGEDLGWQTPERSKFLKELGLSAMRVPQQALMESPDDFMASPHWPGNISTADVALPGTHDYPFVGEFVRSRWSDPPMRALREHLKETGHANDPNSVRDVSRGFMQLTSDSPAGLAILQVFDVLGMGVDDDLPQHLRAFNTPGSAGPENWATRLPRDVLEHGPARDAWVGAMRDMTARAGRLVR